MDREEDGRAPQGGESGTPPPDSPSETAPPPISPWRRRVRTLLRFGLFATVLIVAGALISTYFFGRQPLLTPPNQPGAAINTDQSTAGDMNVYLDALGTVTPVSTITVYSQVSGQILAVHYRQGQIVHAGDPLVDIDPRPYQALLIQAQGALQRDLAILAQARMDLERYRAAWARNAIAEQLLADQIKIVEQAEGLVKADRGTVAYAETQVAYCHILAPVEGQVGLRLVDPGNEVFAGNSSILVVITQLVPITVVFTVPEGDLPGIQTQLRRGGTMGADALGSPERKLIASGTLSYLDNAVDTTTGTVRFRATFPNANLALFPNQFVNIRLHVNTLRRVTLVPSAAIQYNGTNSFVYVVEPTHTVSVHPVTILNGNELKTAVKGLGAGATLATSGFDRLENGVPVTVQNPSHAARAKAPSR